MKTFLSKQKVPSLRTGIIVVYFLTRFFLLNKNQNKMKTISEQLGTIIGLGIDLNVFFEV